MAAYNPKNTPMTKTENLAYGYHIGFGFIPEFVLHIIERLNNAGFNAYLVGGSVRDMLLGRPASDWDIATSASNEEIGRVFHELRHFSIKHETVTIVHNRSHFELTTVRGDSLSKRTIRKDLGHRDFTINALAYDPAGQMIIDPYNGKQDLQNKLIRAVGNPAARFREDPLRLIRAIRISAELGFRIDAETMNAIEKMAHRLNLAAGERIRDELMKILLVDRPSSGLNLLRKSGLMETFLPELMEGYLVRQNHWHSYTVFRHIMETVDRVCPDPVTRLAALFHDIAKPRVRRKIGGEYHFYRHAEESALLASEIMERLRFSNETIRRVTNLIRHHMIEYESSWSDGAVRRLIRRFQPDPVELLMTFRRADILAHGAAAGDELDLLWELDNRIKAIKQRPHAINARDLAIDGKKVMELLRIPQGPEIGRAIEFLLEKITDQPELNREDALEKLLKEFGQGQDGPGPA
jgi:tRNA nucleotidyltransferase (CCA-adding enzyme)